MNFPPYYILFFFNYLMGRTFRMKIGQDLSSTRSVRASVPQGNVLGPQLFLLYINDFPFPRNGILALFADNAAILCSSRNPAYAFWNLQDAAHDIEQWCTDSDVHTHMNYNKCQFMWFSHKKKLLRYPLTFGGNRLNPVSTQLSILAVFLTRNSSSESMSKWPRTKPSTLWAC